MHGAAFWNERYRGEEFIFGTEPNDFLREHIHFLKSPVLSISEGEGRNAVFMAERGLDVVGIDISEVALAKAEALAKSRSVSIRTEVADVSTYIPPRNHYGAVVSVFAHVSSGTRALLYPRLERALMPGGIFLMEAYSENQISRDTGGPKDLDWLMTEEKVRQAFPNMEMLLLREVEREVIEGSGHTGLASVIQCIARTPRPGTCPPKR